MITVAAYIHELPYAFVFGILCLAGNCMVILVYICGRHGHSIGHSSKSMYSNSLSCCLYVRACLKVFML